MDHFESVEQTLKERADDAAELRRQRRRETLPQKIARFGTMSASEAGDLTRDHAAEVDADLARRESEAARAKQAQEAHAAALWQDRYTRQDAEAADRAIQEFCKRHPNFKRSIPRNGALLLKELKLNNELVTVENLEKAYSDLRPRGVFIQVTEEEQRFQRMSADEFKRSRPELLETGLPASVLKNIDRVLATFRGSHPEYIANDSNKATMIDAWEKTGAPVSVHVMETIFHDLVARNELELNHGAISQGFAVRMTDLGGRYPGFPARPDKYSFRQKIEGMTADEIRERCNADPQFRESLDNLEQ